MILAKTAEWLVANKPAGWLTIPGVETPGNKDDRPVLVEELRREHGDLWVVHRLDVETSGVVLFARTAESHRKACEWFEQRQVKKNYECLVLGKMPWPLFMAEQALRGKRSRTQFKEKQNFGVVSWLSAVPLTGRRHQIRMHAAQNGFPIFGDADYGGSSVLPVGSSGIPINRVVLHSVSLELPTGEIFKAPYPEDFESWLQALRSSLSETPSRVLSSTAP